MKAHILTKFSELGLAEPVLKALANEGYETPTPIQAQAIPPLLEGADLLGIAQTGTGKTAAFALPLLTRVFNEKRPAPRRGARVLVLSPTRELAAQIGESFRTYGRQMGVSVAVVFGGVAHRPQVDALSKGVDVLVATPGRLIDHLQTGTITLEGVEALVLDEADQMLDLGFVRPIRLIVSKLRARRQNLFFSATMPREIAALAAELLHDPVRVQVTPVATTAERVTQRVIHIEANKKRPFLVNLFADPDMSRTLVFTRTKRGADRVARHLDAAGIPAVAIHGNKSQRQREVALEAFRSAKTGVLVATDIAARGIDIDAVTHVVNFELPEVPEAYVHRIGRTARAGAEGQAISLCDVAERDLLRAIERVTRQQIPAEDRRNDASIIAEVSTRGTAAGRSTGKPNRFGSSERPDRAARPGRSGKPKRVAGRSGASARPDNGSRPENGARQEQSGRHDRAGAERPHADPRRADACDGRRAEVRDAGAGRRHDRPREGGSAPWSSGPRHRDDRKHASGSNASHAGKNGAGRKHRGNAGEGTRADGAAVAHVFAAIDGRDGRKRGAGSQGEAHHKGGPAKSGSRQGEADNRSNRFDGGNRRRRRAGAPSRRLETA